MNNFKQVALQAAQAAGDVISKLAKQKLVAYEMKNAHDILAEGDIKSEETIIRIIKQHFPDHSILSEEAGKDRNDSEYLWVVDPIDGTINYARGIEEYCISIALSHKGELILGVIYQPVLNKLFVAEKNKGVFLNDQPLHVSSEDQLINTVIATDLTADIEKRKETFEILSSLRDKVRHVRIFGSSALHLGRLAEGQLDVYFKNKFNYWDYAAGIVIVQEAGGKVTDFSGNAIHEDSENIVASNGLTHETILANLSSL